MASNLKPDERIVFFATDAARTADGQWSVPVHAWVHELEPARTRKALFAALLKRKYGLTVTAESRENFERRVGLMCVDNQSLKRIVIDIAGQRCTLPRTGGNGHARITLTLPSAQVAAFAADGRLPLRAVLPEGDDRVFAGAVRLIEPEGLSIISDIDDTVKLTEVRDLGAMMRRTFFEDFQAAPGMAARYRRWAADGAALHFVSSSPWHLYEPLDAFLTAAGFPARSMSLKMVRAKDRSILNLFKKGTETKPEQLRPILARYPQRRFILVGDSGEQDPEVYAAIRQEHPGQIAAIYIRNADDSAATDARYREALGGGDDWRLFTDPAGL